MDYKANFHCRIRKIVREMVGLGGKIRNHNLKCRIADYYENAAKVLCRILNIVGYAANHSN